MMFGEQFTNDQLISESLHLRKDSVLLVLLFSECSAANSLPQYVHG